MSRERKSAFQLSTHSTALGPHRLKQPIKRAQVVQKLLEGLAITESDHFTAFAWQECAPKHRPRCFLVPLLTQAFDSAAPEMCASCGHRPALRPVSGLIITFSPRPLQFLHFRVYNWPVPAQ